MKTMTKTFLLLAGSSFAVSAAAFAGESGHLPGGPLPEPGSAGPAHHSQLFVASGNIRNGQVSLDLPLDAPGNAVLVVFDEHPLAARAPQGGKLQSRPFNNPTLQSMDVPAIGARIELGSLRRGANAVTVESARRSGQLRYAVLQPESALEMVVQAAPLAARSGEPITVTAQLDGVDVASTRVSAKVRGVGKVSLHDDGAGADAIAGDGIFTARFDAPRVKGLQETVIRIDADGRLADGTRFRRTASATAMTSEAMLQLSAADIAIDADGLRIPLNAPKGRFRVEAIYGVKGGVIKGEGTQGQALAWTRDDVQGKRGPRAVSLPRPEAAAAADRVIVRVLDMDSRAVAAEVALDLQPQASGAQLAPAAAPALPASKAAAARQHGLQHHGLEESL